MTFPDVGNSLGTMEEHLKKCLKYVSVKATGFGGGGCICQGKTYQVDGGKKIYVKEHSGALVRKTTLVDTCLPLFFFLRRP